MVKMVAAQKVEEKGNQVFLILSEFCAEGTLFDLLNKYQGQLSEQQTIHILRDISQ